MILSWGELLWDVFPEQHEKRLGGCAANVAYHLAKLGAHPLLVSRVGDDPLGRLALRELQSAGVETSRVQIDASCPTGTVTVDLSGPEPKYSLAQQAAWDRIEASPPVLESAERAAAIVFGTLAQRTPLASVALATVLQSTGGERVCDLNLRPPFDTQDVIEWAIARADVVKVNEHELARVGRILCSDDPVGALHDRHPSMLVLVTLGARGATLATRSLRLRVKSPTVDAGGDSVGAGDAFTAAVAARIAKRGNLPSSWTKSALHELGTAACTYAASTVEHRGAMPIVVSE